MKTQNTYSRKTRSAYLKQIKIVKFWARKQAQHPTSKIVTYMLYRAGYKLNQIYSLFPSVQITA